MLSEPKLENRDAQRYLAIPATLTMTEMATKMPPLFPEVSGWCVKHAIEPAGPPFIRYRVIDMDGFLEIEVGIPVASDHPGDARVRQGILPAGRYATEMYTGHYDGLVAATGALLEWGDAQPIVWAVTDSDRGQVWESRVEVYHTDPDTEPDPAKWRTEIAMLTRED